MKTTCFRIVGFCHFCVLSGLVWPLTTSFETFEPSECTEHFEALTRFGRSYLDCVDSCKNKVECTGISYLRRQLMCRNHFTFGVLKKCPGYVLSMKSEWRHRDGQCVCPATKECDPTEECVLSGCTMLQEPAHGKLYGNMLGIGAKVIFQCNPGYVLNQPGALMCKEDGQWSGESPVCIEGVTCKEANRHEQHLLVHSYSSHREVFIQSYIHHHSFDPKRNDPACMESLVDKVDDGQLSQSSYWCAIDVTPHCIDAGIPDGMTAKYARLTSNGHITGSWSAATGGDHEYIQVDFEEQKVVSGVVLTGRDHVPLQQRGQAYEYVTKFKLLISYDCVTFEAIQDDSGGDKIFDGNTGPEETVTRPLAERVMARCVRINPTAFVRHVSLRFDVLGC